MNMHLATVLLALFASYLLGSICSAIPVCALLNLPDPRTQGSGNPGATNVLRVGGKIPALITLTGDMLKGAIPVLGARLLHQGLGFAALMGLAAFLGHLYPILYRFQGGKGVATAFGVIWALPPWMGAVISLIWLAIFLLTRISSLSALIAFGSMPVLCWFMLRPAFIPLTIMSFLLLARHHRNIAALLRGAEKGFGNHKSGS